MNVSRGSVSMNKRIRRDERGGWEQTQQERHGNVPRTQMATQGASSGVGTEQGHMQAPGQLQGAGAGVLAQDDRLVKERDLVM
jgi:hypothetical protein